MNPSGFVPPAHVHPRQEERFEVVSGTLRGRVAGKERALKAGEALAVPRGTRHTWWNDSNDEVRAIVEFRPALDTETGFEQFFGLGRDGKLSRQGLPNPFQLAVTASRYPDEGYIGYLPWIPVWLQKAGCALVAPVGPLLGYKAHYPEYSPHP